MGFEIAGFRNWIAKSVGGRTDLENLSVRFVKVKTLNALSAAQDDEDDKEVRRGAVNRGELLSGKSTTGRARDDLRRSAKNRFENICPREMIGRIG